MSTPVGPQLPNGLWPTAALLNVDGDGRADHRLNRRRHRRVVEQLRRHHHRARTGPAQSDGDLALLFGVGPDLERRTPGRPAGEGDAKETLFRNPEVVDVELQVADDRDGLVGRLWRDPLDARPTVVDDGSGRNVLAQAVEVVASSTSWANEIFGAPGVRGPG